MQTPGRIAATCLSLGLLAACRSGIQEAAEPLPAEPAQAAQPTSGAGEGEGVGEGEEPSTERADEVAPRADLPPVVGGELLLGARVEDSRGFGSGTVEDALIEPATGTVVAVFAAVERPDGTRESMGFEYGSVVWPDAGSAGPALVLSLPLGELSSRPYADRFDAQEVWSVAGQVTEVAPYEASAFGALVLKLHDQDNLLHRVLVEPAHLVGSRVGAIGLGTTVSAEGVLTRDASGKLLVASALALGGEEVELRGPDGTIRWDVLAQGLLSARELEGRTIVAADGSAVTVTGWLLDRTTGVADGVLVDVDGTERSLPWRDLEQDPESQEWRVPYDWPTLQALPPSSEEDSQG